jgi:hypothetical protein
MALWSFRGIAHGLRQHNPLVRGQPHGLGEGNAFDRPAHHGGEIRGGTEEIDVLRDEAGVGCGVELFLFSGDPSMRSKSAT